MPSAPRGLTVVAKNTTYISLSWDPPAMINANELGPYNITYRTEQATEMVHACVNLCSQSLLMIFCNNLLMSRERTVHTILVLFSLN